MRHLRIERCFPQRQVNLHLRESEACQPSKENLFGRRFLEVGPAGFLVPVPREDPRNPVREFVLEEVNVLNGIVTPRGNRVPFEIGYSGCIEHMYEDTGLPQVIEELVPEATALVGVRHKPRDVEHLHRDQPCAALAGGIVWLARPAEFEVRTLLPDVGNPVIRLDRGEGIVRDVDRGERCRSEEGGLPHVRLSDDPQLHEVKNGLLAQEPWRRGRLKSGIRGFVGDVARSPKGLGACRQRELRPRGTLVR